jgi:lysozyme
MDTDKILQLARMLVAQFEGCRLKAYQDITGRWTVGFGQTGPGITADTVWTQQQADQALQNTLSFLWRRVDQAMTRDLNVNQAAALLSLCYNVGLSAVERSNFWNYLQAGQWAPAAMAFETFDKVRTPGGTLVVVPGLLARRKAERALFEASYP